MKQCSKCKELKDESEFCKDRKAKSGLTSWCKDCQKLSKYKRSDRGKKWQKKYMKKYQQLSKYKLMHKEHNAKRRRNMGFELLFDNIFTEDVDYHHISDAFVLAIPRKIHRASLGKNHRERLKSLVEELYNFSYLIERS